MEDTAIANDVRITPMSELTAYHRQMEEKYSDTIVADTVDADTTKLMAFNGYYALDTAAGAFFAIDTNMLMRVGSTTPIYDLSLLVSLDGATSARFSFTGSFDGTTLIQTGAAPNEFSINVSFVRMGNTVGATASCSGTITLPSANPVTISGTTYNNPIPAALFAGDYYNTTGTHIKVMSIDADNTVMYDNGLNNGTLLPVPSYVYNMNMYFFTFAQGAETASLIMGTAGVQGLTCNNMVSGTTVTTRSLVTIPAAAMDDFEWYDISGSQLADYSGYYQLPAVAKGAFISIQAQYATISEALSLDLYLVMISISLDGVTSQGYYFDPLTMTFENNVLSMPAQNITLTFDRNYNSGTGSLVNLTGSIAGSAVTGSTLFNPVPLSVFGGASMTNQGDSLTVTNDNQVTYNDTIMDSIIYVPLMYILAYPITNSSTVMSFGTNGLKGNACIVTSNIPTAPTTSFVYAIPDAVNA